jgi:hypothetical protein
MSKAVSENIRYRRAGAHAHPVALQPEPVAVYFTSWSQPGPVGTASDLVGRQNSKVPGTLGKIGMRPEFCESGARQPLLKKLFIHREPDNNDMRSARSIRSSS